MPSMKTSVEFVVRQLSVAASPAATLSGSTQIDADWSPGTDSAEDDSADDDGSGEESDSGLLQAPTVIVTHSVTVSAIMRRWVISVIPYNLADGRRTTASKALAFRCARSNRNSIHVGYAQKISRGRSGPAAFDGGRAPLLPLAAPCQSFVLFVSSLARTWAHISPPWQQRSPKTLESIGFIGIDCR